jgi:hypothetical protein
VTLKLCYREENLFVANLLLIISSMFLLGIFRAQKNQLLRCISAAPTNDGFVQTQY